MTSENTGDYAEHAARPGGPRRAGKLQGKIEAQFHTGEALVLVDGRDPNPKDGKRRIYGLKHFAKRTAMIMSASERGDPFADYCLAMIHNRLTELAEFLPDAARTLKEKADARLNPGIRSGSRVAYQTKTWSISPVEEEFHFGHYASRALYSLVQYDEFVLLAKELNHHDVITHGECYRAIENTGNRIRSMLSLGSNYTYTQCTREHLKSRTAVALRAVKRLAEIGFIDMRMYNGVEDVCDTFTAHAPAPHLVPSNSPFSGSPGSAGSSDPSGTADPSGSDDSSGTSDLEAASAKSTPDGEGDSPAAAQANGSPEASSEAEKK